MFYIRPALCRNEANSDVSHKSQVTQQALKRMVNEANGLEMSGENMRSLLLEANGLHGRLITGTAKPASLILCIHGGGCNSRYFNLPLFSFASEAINTGHAVLAIDRPGHGLSPAVPTSTPVRLAAELLPDLVTKARDALDITSLPLALFGHSIGGR